MFETFLFLFYVAVGVYFFAKFNTFNDKNDYKQELIPEKSNEIIEDEANHEKIDIIITPNTKLQFLNNEKYIKFGKHKNKAWTNIPTDYLIWLSHNVEGNGKYRAIQELERRKNAK